MNAIFTNRAAGRRNKSFFLINLWPCLVVLLVSGCTTGLGPKALQS